MQSSDVENSLCERCAHVSILYVAAAAAAVATAAAAKGESKRRKRASINQWPNMSNKSSIVNNEYHQDMAGERTAPRGKEKTLVQEKEIKSGGICSLRRSRIKGGRGHFGPFAYFFHNA